jgi:4-hydroxybenzoate polyprenyltransferase
MSQQIKDTIEETADAVEGSWVYRRAPMRIRPYLKLARLDRPIGTWLLLWPCLWSMTLSISGYSVLELGYVALLFAIGALAMRGAGCTYNDIVDRDFDGQVERTRSRPIPAGEVSVRQAWAFLVFQCLIGLGVLLQFNRFTIYLGLGSLVLVAVYPFMKRITGWPQAWLGLTFNWGALMGWAALDGSLSWAAVVLYFGTVFWTLGYDTIYAHQDKEDDVLIGVGSTALTLGENTLPALWLFYGLFFIGLLTAGTLANLGLIFYVGIAFAGVQLVSQIRKVDLDDPAVCLAAFRSNTDFGGTVLLSILLGHVAV